MAKLSRKEFLGFGAVLAGATGFASGGLETLASAQPSVGAGPGVAADLIVTNARVLTSDPSLPRAEAFAVRNGRFIAVGSNAEVRILASAQTRPIDAAGATIYLSGKEPLSHGRWWLQGDKYCSQWPPQGGWACYAVMGDPDARPPTLTWIGDSGRRYPSTVAIGNVLKAQ